MVTIGFQNSYPSTVWIMALYLDYADCTGYGNWMIKGWWKLDPGQQANVFDTTNRYSGFYAEAADGSYWAGPYGPYLVTKEGMSLCYAFKPAPPNFTVGMRLIDADPPWWAPWWNYTVNLIP
jgi:hypothetical protein